jgi:hypothetical protein
VLLFIFVAGYMERTSTSGWNWKKELKSIVVAFFIGVCLIIASKFLLDWLIDLYNAYLKEQEALRLQIKADKRFELWQQNQLKKAEEETEALLKAEKQNAEMWWYCVSIVGIVVVSVAVVVVVVAVVSGK